MSHAAVVANIALRGDRDKIFDAAFNAASQEAQQIIVNASLHADALDHGLTRHEPYGSVAARFAQQTGIPPEVIEADHVTLLQAGILPPAGQRRKGGTR